MAVNKTGAMFKSLTFDGEDSRNYGVYITGQAVFNAPEREVEMISIPGRNGQFALDMGRFENIEVTYPAGIFANTEAEFAEAVSNFRNLLCSRRGYVRLQDEYHPDEYRMAIYKSGLELENVALKAGEFEITFDCKPQRYLTSGETESPVANNGTLTNPTLFDAEPLLEVEGYGTIEFNGYNINLANATMGEVEIVSNETMTQTSYDPMTEVTVLESQAVPIADYANVGDDFTASINLTDSLSSVSVKSITSATITTSPTNGSASVSFTGKNASLKISGVELSGASNADSQVTTSCSASIVYVNTNNSTQTATISLSLTLAFDATSQKLTVTSDFTPSGAFHSFGDIEAKVKSFIVDSTVSILGHPTYIDCELGECYRIENGTVISLNRYIDLGSDLPKIAPGGNVFTIDNTITELKVVPKWWKV